MFRSSSARGERRLRRPGTRTRPTGVPRVVRRSAIWTSLDAVPRGTELRFVRGSHLWERPLAKPYFEQERLGGARPTQAGDAMPVPDFDGADRDRFDLVGWEMEPGDIVVFHAMTVHGGSGRLPATMERRAISTQWLGEDARLVDRPGGHDPHWLPEFAEFGLGPGDYPGCAMCPEDHGGSAARRALDMTGCQRRFADAGRGRR